MIDDFRRPSKRIPLQPTKINPEIFRPGSATASDSTKQTMPASDPNTVSSIDSPPIKTIDAANIGEPKPQKKTRKFWATWSKRKRIICLLIASVVIIGSGALIWQLTRAETPTKTTAKKTVAPTQEPVKYYSSLSGLEVTDPAINTSTVTAVMIENSQDARPQSGLKDAGVVFEAIAEGGITRFMALYQDTEPDYLGPVRSARPYYVQWARGYDAAYAHVGGSPLGLQTIRDLGVRDLDQGANGGSYERVTSRYSPHNVYTSLAALNQLEQKKGFIGSTYTGFERKEDAKSSAPTATKIDLAISSALYNAHYDYDAASNSYLRSEGGVAHMNLAKDGTQTQLTSKVVAVMIMSYSQSGIYSVYGTTGSGQAYIFQDGIAVSGTWHKDSAEAPITFKDAAGTVIQLNRGQTWITALASPDKLTFTP